MKFIRRISNILVNNSLDIKTVQSFEEDAEKVILQVAEYVPEFKRGFTCDMECNYTAMEDTGDLGESFKTEIKDLVLVYIIKNSSYDSLTTFKYVFFK